MNFFKLFVENIYLYCGEQFDANTGFYYLRARYMNPSTGTFISMDTYQGSLFDPVSLHKYLYANANPVMYCDPTGYFTLGEALTSMAIQGVLSALLTTSVSLISFFTTAEPGTPIPWGMIAIDAILGFSLGVFFGGSFMLAKSLQSFAIYAALGFSSLIFAGSSLWAGYEYEQAGNSEMAIVSYMFGVLGLFGSYTSFKSAWATPDGVALRNWAGDKLSGGSQPNSWYNSDGSLNYPPNNGAVVGTDKNITLEVGKRLGRYGEIKNNSQYVTDANSSPNTLSLPPNTDPNLYTEFEVIKSIPKTTSSIVAPWGTSPGGGTQYYLPNDINWLLRNGYIIQI